MEMKERKSYDAPMLIGFVVAVERGFKESDGNIDDFVEIEGNW